MVLRMQSLRVVGPGEDGSSLILESLDGAERFSLPLDERLRDVSFPHTPTSDQAETTATDGNALSPRTIQTRVRAGESAESVADSAGVPLDKVMRFAFPVLAERVRVVDEARRARTRRVGESGQIDFGELIDHRLSEHGVNTAAVGWDAYRREDGGWTVVAAFSAAEKNRVAKFNFVLLNRTVSALDALAADLLSERPVQALLPAQPDPVPALDGESAPVRLSAVPDQPPAGEPALSSTPAVRPGRRQKAHTGPIPVGADDDLFDQEAFAPSGQAGWQEPPLPLDLGPDGEHGEQDEHGQPDSDEPKGKRGRRGDKPRMPSWDDILLGVRHKND
jgi:hypothetical protein